jgi:uncharacterized protein YheU (UPF0270 family)
MSGLDTDGSAMTDVEMDAAPIIVPPAALAVETLRGVVEAFVLREGTDYGEREVAFEEKCRQVQAQIERGEVHIVFDPVTQSVSIHAAD